MYNVELREGSMKNVIYNIVNLLTNGPNNSYISGNIGRSISQLSCGVYVIFLTAELSILLRN